MGWTSAQRSKDSVIAEIIRPFSNGDGKHVSTRKHSVQGSELWHIQDVKDSNGVLIRSYIVCTIFECSGGSTAWKTIDESMGPCYYRVPLSYLDEVPSPGGFADEWRETVRAQAKQRTESAQLSKNLQPGSVIVLPDSCKPNRLRLVHKVKTSWTASDIATGLQYKVGPAMLARVVSVE
jgi:hypothetical protein